MVVCLCVCLTVCLTVHLFACLLYFSVPLCCSFAVLYLAMRVGLLIEILCSSAGLPGYTNVQITHIYIYTPVDLVGRVLTGLAEGENNVGGSV